MRPRRRGGHSHRSGQVTSVTGSSVILEGALADAYFGWESGGGRTLHRLETPSSARPSFFPAMSIAAGIRSHLNLHAALA